MHEKTDLLVLKKNQELEEIEEKDQYERHDFIAVEKSIQVKQTRPNLTVTSPAINVDSFNQKHNLKIHKRFHTGEKPFTYDQCGKCFKHKVTLRSHTKRKHSQHESSHCSEAFLFANSGNSFSHKGSFKLYTRLHT